MDIESLSKEKKEKKELQKCNIKDIKSDYLLKECLIVYQKGENLVLLNIIKKCKIV